MYSIYIVRFSQGGKGLKKKSTFCTLAKKLKIVDHPFAKYILLYNITYICGNGIAS